MYAASFYAFNDGDVNAFVSVDFDAFWCYGLSSALLVFGEFLDELFVFFYFFV